MKILCWLILVLASLGLPHPASAQRPDRIGLFIGNANYPDASTPLTTTKDARALADEFRRLSVQTEIKENVKKDEMRRAIDAFLSKVSKDSVAILYFGGYGLQVERQNYLVPVNAEIWNEGDVKREGVSIESIVGEMDRKGAAVKIIIIDAAYRNPFERRFRNVPAGLTALDSPTGTLVIYSTALGRVANASSGPNSLLVSELVKELRAPARSVEGIFNSTRRGVSRASNNEQVPWVASSLADRFSLSQTQATSPPPAPTVTQTQPAPPPPPAPTVTQTPAPPPPAPTVTQTPAPPPPAPTASVGPRRAFIGLNYRFSTNADAERVNAGARRGAFVLNASPNAPAAEAGLRADDLVFRANGEYINKTEDLVRITSGTRPGEMVRLSVFRNAREEEVRVTPISLEEAGQRGIVSAMTALGTIYRTGDTVPRNYAEARKWFEKAAAAKDVTAMVSLGLMYRDGEGVPRDSSQAREWMEKAAALNSNVAMYVLGQIYANGTGVMRDAVTAKDWYEKSAQRNYVPAMYALGVMHETGNGIAVNRNTAIAWYEKAAAAGNEDAKKALARLK
jgi:hypothetical protein